MEILKNLKLNSFIFFLEKMYIHGHLISRI